MDGSVGGWILSFSIMTLHGNVGDISVGFFKKRRKKNRIKSCLRTVLTMLGF